MRMRQTIIAALGIAALAVAAQFMPRAFVAHAQTAAGPTLWVTWRATSSTVPSFYEGKALPSTGSQVTAEVALIANGHIQNLSQQTVYWYLDDTLIGNGTKVTFTPFGTPPDFPTLKVELPSWNGQYLIHAVQIPYANPAVAIYAPYAGSQFSSNPVELTALPYFFASSPSNLTYSWSVNGQTGSSAENPEVADVTLPQGTPSGTGITVSLNVADPSNGSAAGAQSTLTYVSQL